MSVEKKRDFFTKISAQHDPFSVGTDALRLRDSPKSDIPEVIATMSSSATRL